MGKIKKVGKLPVNSRITIDYSKDKPKIKFGYPRKDVDRQVAWNSTAVFYLGLIFFIFILSLLYINVFLVNTQIELAPEDCTGSINYYQSQYNISYYFVDNITLYCNNGFNQTLEWNYGHTYNLFGLDLTWYIDIWQGYQWSPQFENKINYPSENYLFFIAVMNIGLIIFIISIFALCLRLSKIIFAKTKWGRSKFPYFSKALAGKGHYVCFRKVKDKVIEIPLFRNIYLDYNATKDFSKYLKKVEIREHPFQQIVRKGKKKKKLKNVAYWNCKFYLGKIPKTGKLEVWFH